MGPFFRSFTKKLFIAATISVSLLFLLSCSAWWLEPGTFWWVGILGVGFAFLFFASLALMFFWMAIRSKWFILPFFAMLIGFRPINAFFALHPFTPKKLAKPEAAIRVMQWNVERFDEMKNIPRSGKRKEILAFIRKQSPDIICMQEFLETHNPALMDPNIAYFRDSLGYSYYSYAMDHRRPDGLYEHGVAIFSRFPIINTHRRKFGGPKALQADESFLTADINVNGQTIRVLTTHLQSLLFAKKDFDAMKEIKANGEVTLDDSRSIFRKFKQAYNSRQKQAEKIRRALDASPYPEIICGDFNDVPNSFVYNEVRGDRKDVWTRSGFGIGRTFSFISPTLRIDYIFTDPRIKVVQVRNPHPHLSDHFPVIADLILPTEN